MDKRIKRTRSAVFNAMLDLMVEKETSKITVLELCKKADINKSTFYLHYSSMEDCTQKCFETIMDGIVRISKLINYNELKANPKPVADTLIREVEKKADYLYRFKSSSICGPSIKLLKENLVESIAEHNGFNREDNYYEYANITFAVAGMVDIMIEMLPNFNKELLSKTICTMLKSANN
ncbi:MAG: TetR family transcriptional regulator [Clostridium sp.]|nr:TetR family transcriptional regulator [Clostridium sp.]